MKRVFLILLIVLFVVGCQNTPFQRDSKGVDYRTGVSEVEVEFVKNVPPYEVYENSQFQIVPRIVNKAAYPIENGVVTLVGFDRRYFEVFPLTEEFGYLEGRSELNPVGGIWITDPPFDGIAGELTKRNSYRVGFLARVDYSSFVEYAETVCINSDLYNVHDAGCTVDVEKTYSGQGAPVAITEMEQIITPGFGVEFRFNVRNRGDGRIKRLVFGSAALGGREISCVFKDGEEQGRSIELDLDETEATLVCNTFVRSFQSYETTLTMSLAYDYAIEEERGITIIK